MQDESAPRQRAPGVLLHRAAFYDALLWMMTFGREGRLREKMLRLARIAEGEAVLDVGCGTGTLAILAKRRAGAGGDVCGVDASPEMIERARQKARKAGSEVAFEIAPAQSLPFADHRFDLALATMMLHHLGRPARAQCLRELARVLKPGGRVLVIDFESSGEKRGFLAHLHRRHGHVAALDVDALLADAGFTVIDRGPVGFRDLHFSLATLLRSPQ
jgi:ubiquinone/menaquinone biosynthesis C-methylase UbiE